VAHVMLAALDPIAILMTIVGLGGLIFFHELGHFLACRLTGTRVEAFSIGFGKEILGWTRGGTRYRIGVVPLGGYVKMAAENPGERRTGAPDEFPNKPFSARLFIMSAGVLFNLILAFALFAWAYGVGVPLQREIGAVTPGSPAWRAGLKPGDIVTHFDGRPVMDFIDLLTEDLLGGGAPVVLTVERQGKALEVSLPARVGDGPDRLGVHSAFEDAAVAVAKDSPIARAGGREGDVVLAVNGEPLGSPAAEIEPILGRLAGQAGPDSRELEVVFRIRRADGTIEDLRVRVPLEELPLIGITPHEGNRIESVVGSPAHGLLLPGDEIVRVNGSPVLDLRLLREGLGDEALTEWVVRRDGVEVAIPVPPGATVGALCSAIAGRLDLTRTRITPNPDGPAARAGIRPGDVLVAVAGKPVATFVAAADTIRANGMKPLEIEIERDGKRETLTLSPGRRSAVSGPLGYAYAKKSALFHERNVFRAAAAGWRRTMRLIETTVRTVTGLVTRRVSTDNIGGPIALATITYNMFDQGWGLFLQILGLISVNLAILNLLPIPILDGGQIVLLVAEKLRGKPLPERVVGYLQVAGLVLILGLIVLAFRNDITRMVAE